MNEQVRVERFSEAHRVQRLEEIRQEIRDYAVGASFGERMLRLRRLLGMRQKDLALALGVSVRTIIRHERGQCEWLLVALGEPAGTEPKSGGSDCCNPFQGRAF